MPVSASWKRASGIAPPSAGAVRSLMDMCPPRTSQSLASLERVEGDVREGVNQFSPCRARDDVARLPDPDTAGRNTDPVSNDLGALGLNDLRVHHPATLLRVIQNRNHFVTRGDGTLGNVWRMTARWQECEGTWDRLRWARMRWQESNGISPNAEAAAESLGVKAGTYRAYERRPGSSKHIPLDHQTAPPLAKKFGVSWLWLLTGDGTPDDLELTPNERRIISAYREAPEARQTAVADAIEQLLKIA